MKNGDNYGHLFNTIIKKYDLFFGVSDYTIIVKEDFKGYHDRKLFNTNKQENWLNIKQINFLPEVKPIIFWNLSLKNILFQNGEIIAILDPLINNP